jgi:KUP system potassium uptake protein
MTTWKTGRQIIADRFKDRAVPLGQFMVPIIANPPLRVPGTAVFMTAQPGTPPALMHNLQYNKILHEQVIVLTVSTVQTPHVEPGRQIQIDDHGHGLYNIRLRFGFMEDPDVPAALDRARSMGVAMNPEDTTYFLGRETIIVTDRPGMAMWREKLFVLMARNAIRATRYFRLPLERVVELGVQVEM